MKEEVKDVKDVKDVIAELTRSMQHSFHLGIAEQGDRVRIFIRTNNEQCPMKMLRGYVGYCSEFGGFFVYANHKVKAWNHKNTTPIDVYNVVHICPANIPLVERIDKELKIA